MAFKVHRVRHGSAVIDATDLPDHPSRVENRRADGDSALVNLIDTPGHPDFIAEVDRVLGVLDGLSS